MKIEAMDLREQEGVMGGIGREGREGENDIISKSTENQ